MSLDTLFQIANTLALLGWLALLIAPLSPRWADRTAAIALPLILSLAYAALIMAFWSGAEGGFDSLPNVMVLFETPAIALAGWLHYLAFDLFVGAWQVRSARTCSIPHLLILPCLVLTFLFGPMGLLCFFALRAIYSLRTNPELDT